MRSVPCSNTSCSNRRVHHERQDVMRVHKLVEVPDNHPPDGEAFCSITCACEAGAYDVRVGFIKKEDRRKTNGVG